MCDPDVFAYIFFPLKNKGPKCDISWPNLTAQHWNPTKLDTLNPNPKRKSESDNPLKSYTRNQPIYKVFEKISNNSSDSDSVSGIGISDSDLA